MVLTQEASAQSPLAGEFQTSPSPAAGKSCCHRERVASHELPSFQTPGLAWLEANESPGVGHCDEPVPGDGRAIWGALRLISSPLGEARLAPPLPVLEAEACRNALCSCLYPGAAQKSVCWVGRTLWGSSTAAAGPHVCPGVPAPFGGSGGCTWRGRDGTNPPSSFPQSVPPR